MTHTTSDPRAELESGGLMTVHLRAPQLRLMIRLLQRQIDEAKEPIVSVELAQIVRRLKGEVPS